MAISINPLTGARINVHPDICTPGSVVWIPATFLLLLSLMTGIQPILRGVYICPGVHLS